jgi:hypothetical protein
MRWFFRYHRGCNTLCDVSLVFNNLPRTSQAQSHSRYCRYSKKSSSGLTFAHHECSTDNQHISCSLPSRLEPSRNCCTGSLNTSYHTFLDIPSMRSWLQQPQCCCFILRSNQRGCISTDSQLLLLPARGSHTVLHILGRRLRCFLHQRFRSLDSTSMVSNLLCSCGLQRR